LGVRNTLHPQNGLKLELRRHIEYKLVRRKLIEECRLSTVVRYSQKVNCERDVFGRTQVGIVVDKASVLLVDHIVLAVNRDKFDLLNFALSEV
jgi:hypothetical protein